MKRIFIRSALAVSGGLLGLIGSGLMFMPHTFLSMSDVIVGSDPSLMSELSAPSGVLLIAGGFMILGAINRRFSYLALSVGAIVYGSYGFGRLVSMGIYGLPNQSLLTATMIEFGVAALLIGMRLTVTTPKRNVAESYLGGAIV